jgi:uncharacterized protein (UPF0332 family)
LKPSTARYLRHAERKLADAEGIFAAGFREVAAREAYLSALSAARAIIFEVVGKAAKTHTGVRTTFLKLVHDGMPFDRNVADFLAEGFELKTSVDYEDSTEVSPKSAAEALAAARAFLAATRAVVEGKS